MLKPNVRETRPATGSLEAQDTASYRSPAYDDMAPRWEVCRDAMGGTETIRNEKLAAVYMPQEPAESDEEFKLRVARAEMYPAFKETVKGLTGMVFSVDPELGEDVPEKISDLWENIDGAGTHGAVFMRQVFQDGMQAGHFGIYVDYPAVLGKNKRPLTKKQEAALGLRPYWIHIKPEQILSWRTQVINGHTVLTQVVFEETTEEPVGKFTSTEVTRYRCLRRAEDGTITFEVYRAPEREGEEPTLETEGVMQNVTAIPFVVGYCGERKGPLKSLPPLLDLAYMNFSHVQVLSDRRTSLHKAGNPILVTKGLMAPPQDPNRPAGDTEQETLDVGANFGLMLPADANADVFYAEHQGHALGAAREELQDIEKRMAAQGMSMLQNDTRAAETAESHRIERSQQDASLTSAARSAQDAGETALAFTAVFLGLETGGSLTMTRDFTDKLIDTDRIRALGEARDKRNISLETYWKLLATGGALPEDFDPVTERERLDAEEPITLGTGAGGGDPDNPGAPADGGEAGGATGGGAAGGGSE